MLYCRTTCLLSGLASESSASLQTERVSEISELSLLLTWPYSTGFALVCCTRPQALYLVCYMLHAKPTFC